jgi:hypothetical protein
MTKHWLTKICIGLSALSTLAFAGAALADQAPCGTDPTDPLALNCVSAGSGNALTATDPRILASRVINVILGVLGTIATLLIFYAGFLWMTAAGNDDQIGKAKSIMSAAVIGLVVILASYSISTYFINSIRSVVNGTQPGA